MTLVFLLEEKSMKVFLDNLLPRILPPNVSFFTIAHEGKTDRELQKLLPEHQQIEGAKRISQYIDIQRNTSVSFQVFCRVCKKCVNKNAEKTIGGVCV